MNLTKVFFFCTGDQLDLVQLILELHVEDFKNNPINKYIKYTVDENELYLILIDSTKMWSYCRVNSKRDQEFYTKTYSDNNTLIRVEDILTL